jgi:hypothetical protein
MLGIHLQIGYTSLSWSSSIKQKKKNYERKVLVVKIETISFLNELQIFIFPMKQ